MGVPAVDWLAVVPWLLPAVGAVLVLALDALLPRRLTRGPALPVITLAALAQALLALVPLSSGTRSTFCATAGRCSYVAGHLTSAVQLVALGSALVCLLLALAERRPDGAQSGTHLPARPG